MKCRLLCTTPDPFNLNIWTVSLGICISAHISQLNFMYLKVWELLDLRFLLNVRFYFIFFLTFCANYNLYWIFYSVNIGTKYFLFYTLSNYPKPFSSLKFAQFFSCLFLVIKVIGETVCYLMKSALLIQYRIRICSFSLYFYFGHFIFLFLLP